jgi:hypothetical protein
MRPRTLCRLRFRRHLRGEKKSHDYRNRRPDGMYRANTTARKASASERRAAAVKRREEAQRLAQHFSYAGKSVLSLCADAVFVQTLGKLLRQT